MKFTTFRFNLYLLSLALAAGCQTGGAGKPATMLRLHLEVNRDGSDRNGPVVIGRAAPFVVNVERQPFLTESHIVSAAIVDDPQGGFQLRVQFDRRGTWLLEQYTTANKGKHCGVFSVFGQARWLGAPLMERRIADGVFTFTPDASREEAERIVRGLHEVGRAVKKQDR
jgi:preprotein translocase subunit SecD